MDRRAFLVVSLLAISAAIAQAPTKLQLFGVELKGATRAELRQALVRNGMRATREDNSYWVDTYDPNNVLEGATKFGVGYVGKESTFAYAVYEFPGFVNPGLVTKVIRMVTTKYGPPSSKKGSDGLGEVTATWDMPQGMRIEVWRGWPDTTTYLTFEDVVAHRRMKQEIEAQRRANERAKAKSQSDAF